MRHRPGAASGWGDMTASGQARPGTRPGPAPVRLPPAAVVFCLVVVLAAGASALALLRQPDDTGEYFSWVLRPPAAAALIGGLYLGSAVLFGWTLTLRWRQALPLFVASFGLTVPTLVLTVIHDQVFDFLRWQAVAWVVVFAVSPLAIAGILAATFDEPGPRPRLAIWARLVLGLFTVGFGVLAWAIWVDRWRDDIAPWSPVDLVGLTGSYFGSWCALVAVLLGWAAIRGTWDDVRLPTVALGLLAGGAAVGIVRSWDEVHRPALAVAVALALVAVAAALYLTSRPEPDRRGASPPP